MVLFRYASELVDMPSKLLVVMQGSVGGVVVQRFERVVELSPKVRVGVIDYEAFITLLSELGVAELPPARGVKNPRCGRCGLVYLTSRYRMCIICGRELITGSRRARRRTRKFIDVGEVEET